MTYERKRNIWGLIAQASMIRLIHRLVRLEAHNWLLVQLIKLDVNCCTYCWLSFYLAPASTTDWEGSGAKCFPRLHHASCRTYRKEKICTYSTVTRKDNPHSDLQVSLNWSTLFFFLNDMQTLLFWCVIGFTNRFVHTLFPFLFTNAKKHSDALTSACLEL